VPAFGDARIVVMKQTEVDFVIGLARLIDEHADMPREQMLQLVQQTVTPLPGLEDCRIAVVPFVTGRRPTVEAQIPGLGSSDNAALLETGPDNRTYILFDVRGNRARLEAARATVEARLLFCGADESTRRAVVPGWDWRPVALRRFALDAQQRAVLEDATWSHEGRFVLALRPEQDLRPGNEWSFEKIAESLRELATDSADPYTFGHQFMQRIHCELRVRTPERMLGVTSYSFVAADKSRMGGLYQRIIDRVVMPDTEGQFKAAGVTGPDVRFHPWFPVLHIGSDKARLFTRALVEDIVNKHDHLTNPLWLMQVGVYLELLTCIGIFEAAKGDIGDKLTSAERRIFDRHPSFASLRRRIDVAAWKRVWGMREMVFHKLGVPQTGPVVASNLLRKKDATLAFLHAHHSDLKHAIALSGPNLVNAQETWGRVFRDAERAVLRKTPDAFPELTHLAEALRKFVLWHRKGDPVLGVPGWLSAMFGDQDGLYGSACVQYRRSMNDVAAWAKPRGLMEYAGEECVPPEVSLMISYLDGRPAELAALQQRDGYEDTLEIQQVQVKPLQVGGSRIGELIERVDLFKLLTIDERAQLAASSRCLPLGPMQRILIEGRAGESLFIIEHGEFQVLVTQPDGTDRIVDTMTTGEVIGEMSLLTGQHRSATVRAGRGGGSVVEIGRRQYEPLIRQRPTIIDAMAQLMAARLAARAETMKAASASEDDTPLSARIRRFFLGA
jgi:CRP-like cAMP-binding protein